MTVFVIDSTAVQTLTALKERAEERPISLEDMERMSEAFAEGRPYTVIPEDQTITLPMGWTVTFTHENHPSGLVRHMSMASPNRSRVPLPMALEMVMEHLGFTQKLEHCMTWFEPLNEGDAVNVVEIFG